MPPPHLHIVRPPPEPPKPPPVTCGSCGTSQPSREVKVVGLTLPEAHKAPCGLWCHGGPVKPDQKPYHQHAYCPASLKPDLGCGAPRPPHERTRR